MKQKKKDRFQGNHDQILIKSETSMSKKIINNIINVMPLLTAKCNESIRNGSRNETTMVIKH